MASARASWLELSAGEISTLMMVADADQNGMIDYYEFIDLAYNVLLHMAREKALKGLGKLTRAMCPLCAAVAQAPPPTPFRQD